MRLEFFQRHTEGRILCNPLEQIVFAALLLNDASRLHGVNPDAFVQLLPVAAPLDASIIRFSVAMKGRYSRQVRSTIFSLTWSPSVTF